MRRPAVYLIGAGPGDPRLITIYGLECLRAADVVVYDHLVPRRLLKDARAGAELIDVGASGSATSATFGPFDAGPKGSGFSMLSGPF